jgi:translation initiation factor 2B subunit (eIF-2B alpha/beta/delta family)
MVAVMARIQAEIEELKRRQNSTHLWRPHADALILLEQAAVQATHSAQATLQLASQRGLVEKAKILTATMDRLRNRVDQVHEALALAGVSPEPSLR